MAATVAHPRPPAAHRPPRPDRRFGAGRAVGVVASSITLLLSVAALGLGLEARITDQAIRDDEGYLTAVAIDVDSDGHAVISEGIAIDDDLTTRSLPRQVVGVLRIEVESSSGPVFVGIADSVDVDAYLADVRHTTVVAIEGGRRPTYDVTDGYRVPDPPVAAGIWEESTSGAGRQILYFEPREGDWTLVVMRPDGGAPMDAHVRVGATAPWVDDFAYAMLGLGLLLGAGGALGLWSALGRRDRRRRRRPTGHRPVG